jgi:hypothetical protein
MRYALWFIAWAVLFAFLTVLGEGYTILENAFIALFWVGAALLVRGLYLLWKRRSAKAGGR